MSAQRAKLACTASTLHVCAANDGDSDGDGDNDGDGDDDDNTRHSLCRVLYLRGLCVAIG